MDTNFTNVKRRVLQISDIKNINKEIFFNEIDISYASFKGKALDKNLNSATLTKIVTKFPDVDPLWLLTGEGKPIKDKVDKEATTIYRNKTDRAAAQQAIPLYDVHATAGLVELFADSNKNVPVELINIPNLPKCDGAVYVTGDSMYPLLKSGDIVIYKEINDVVNNIFWGEMYLISIDLEGEEYISVKYIQKSDLGKDYIKLVSQNANHQPKDISLSKVRALAIVKASIRVNSMG
jgi:phage repressor protein C with HTH and peptisase S24 domain